ncbi:MAG TPA: general stress protein CsbD [Chitinophagales bacterium]|nr:general stress protein CsbD [Chitinophagales bacterium]
MSTTATQSPERENWNKQMNKLKARFLTLTDADLQYEEGQKDALLTRLQNKLGITRPQLDAIISPQIIY